VTEAVEFALPRLLLQLLHQNLRLLVHHFQEVRQDREVEGRGQHLPPLMPLAPGADRKKAKGQQGEMRTLTFNNIWSSSILISAVGSRFDLLTFS